MAPIHKTELSGRNDTTARSKERELLTLRSIIRQVPAESLVGQRFAQYIVALQKQMRQDQVNSTPQQRGTK